MASENHSEPRHRRPVKHPPALGPGADGEPLPLREVSRSLAVGALTLIIAFEVMRKRVARSFTAFSFSPLSDGILRLSSSFRERWSAAPCLAMRSLHVLRSFNFNERFLRVWWSSLLSPGAAGSSSSSPESSKERDRVAVTNQARVSAVWTAEGREPPQRQRTTPESDQCPRQRPAMLLARAAAP